MTLTYGPKVTKLVDAHCPCCRQYTGSVEVLDDDAYWWLHWTTGEPEAPGVGIGYAKVAYPTLARAQAQLRMQRSAMENERGAAAKRPRRRKAVSS